jgi:hypothetical protein
MTASEALPSYQNEMEYFVSAAYRLLAVMFPIGVAQFLTLCSASTLAEALRLSLPLQSLSPAKRRASSMSPRAYVHHRRPSTNC